MSRHLVEWLLVNPIELPHVENVGTDRAWRVLMSLANRAHENTGKMTASDRTQERDTGLERRGVIQPVRKALEQAGWLVDTGKREAKGVKVYELIVPGYCRPSSSGEGDLATKTVDNQVSGVASGVGSGVGSGEGDLAQTELNRTSPPTSPKGRQAGQEGLTQEGIELLTHLLNTENYSGLRNERAVRTAKRRDYLPIVKAWEQERPQGDPATWCRHKYLGTTPAQYVPPMPQGQENCPHGCNALGYHMIRDEVGVATTKKCTCVGGNYPTTQEPTTERVSADKATTTYLPSPSAPADPQSDPVRELTRRLKAV